MRRAILSATVVAVALALGGCSAIGDLLGDEPARDEAGQVTEATTDDAFALKVGDCLDSADLGELVEEVPFIPCDEPHDSEVFAVTDLAGDEYPGDEAVETQATEFCRGQSQSFVGPGWDESELDMFPMYPLEEGWNEIGDREVLCLVVDLEGGITGTLKGAGR